MTRILLVGVILATSLAMAEEAPAAAAPGAEAPAAEKKADPKWYDKVKLEGLVDAYYSYRIQGKTSDRVNELRAFDPANNTFSFGYAKVALSMPAEPAGFRMDIGFGPTADFASSDIGISSAAGGGASAVPSAASEVVKHVQQAYATAKLFDRVTIDLGKFNTSVGSEVIEANVNWLQSHSLLFTYGPYTHTGLRIAAPIITDVWTVQVGVVNGWDTVFASQIWKTFNVSTALTFSSGTSIYLNLYVGPHSTPDIRLIADLVLNQNIGDKFALNVNADYGFEGATSWYGASLMAKFQPVDMLRISARVEYFGDPQGARTTFAGSFVDATIGAGIIFSGLGNVEIRPEVRHDQALGGITPFVGGTSASQTSLMLAMVAWF